MPLIQKAKKIYKATDLEEQPISILCLSIDRLSAIEEEYGAEAAKAVVREFGGTLIGATREDDLVGRHEENMFIAVIINTGNNYAEYVVQRFQELAHADVLLVDEREVRYSICVGYSSSDANAQQPDFDSLFERAREALENAKEQGPATTLRWAA